MFELGTIIGEKYCLEQQVGEGGMASIWRAVHMDLDRPVAVKFVNAIGPRASALIERFMREARVAASVRHRNVVDILDFGKTEDGHPYMVMELLHGKDLADHLDQGLSIEELVRMVADALRGLAAVHEAGIVHRDVKPENIFLNEEPDGLCPKLLDFGISRGSASAQAGTKAVTLEGMFIGTPQYMSPEQARGLKGIDGRTDIYSMGVVLYEGLTGRPPFESEAVGDLIMEVTTGVAPTVAALLPEVGEPLSTVVERAMARNPEDRFPDARTMREALLDAAEKTAAISDTWGKVRITRRPPPFPVSHVTTLDPPKQEDADVREDDGPARPRGRRLWLLLAALVLAAAGTTVGIQLMRDDGVTRGRQPTAPDRETTPVDSPSPPPANEDVLLPEEPVGPEPAAAPPREQLVEETDGDPGSEESPGEGDPEAVDRETRDLPTGEARVVRRRATGERRGQPRSTARESASRTAMSAERSGPFEDPGF